jgi:tyrosyl-tRNA synthetase
MTSGSTLLDALRSRGLLYQNTEGLAEHLARGPLTAYCGFDPTAASLHVGNLVPAMGLLRLAQAGHRVIALAGGGTALIGDPGGKSAERPLLSVDEVAANADAIAAQLSRVLGGEVRVINNADWLRPLGAIEFLRDVGKHFPVNQMLAKDTVKSRLETGISFTEFSYMLLQAYDYLQLFSRHGVTLQIGGSDQWGNITAGVELIRRSAAGEAHALTYPLITTASGKKLGKTEAGAVWLDAARTSPYAFYQYWVNTDDADVGRLLRLFTLLPDADIDALLAAHERAPGARTAHRALAEDVTRRVHGELVRSAIAVSDTVFDPERDPAQLSDDEFAMLRDNIPSLQLAATSDTRLLDCMATLYDVSKGEARRVVGQGGLSINRARVAPEKETLSAADAIRGRWLLFRKGKRDVRLAELVR